MYFDADDQVSPINEIAQSIEELLPSYELEKVAQDRKGPIRGVCVLEYKPTTSIIEGNNVIGLPPVGSQLISENQYRQFSVMQIRHVLEFQESPEGRAQYKAHDNPMHGLFGNINHYC